MRRNQLFPKINESMDIMQAARLKVKLSFDRFIFRAKKFIKEGKMEEARNELKEEIKKTELIKEYDMKMYGLLNKLKALENGEQLINILDIAKSCISALLNELNDEKIIKSTVKLKEYKDLIENEKEINKYIDIINSIKNNND